MAAKGTKAKGGKEWGRKARKEEGRMTRATKKAEALADADAAWGNDRVARGAFITERMAQTGCLAVEAARAWEAGER